jgi:hypothetical protein
MLAEAVSFITEHTEIAEERGKEKGRRDERKS